MLVTLSQAVELAGEKYHKRPARDTLKSAVKEGRLKAIKAMTQPNRICWLIEEDDLAEYLLHWTPGQAAPPGNKRRVGKLHTPESKEKIARSVSKFRNSSF
jgi:hypothetical protein